MKDKELSYFVDVIRYSDDEIVERMGPMSESKAEKVDRGVNINISNSYYTRITST